MKRIIQKIAKRSANDAAQNQLKIFHKTRVKKLKCFNILCGTVFVVNFIFILIFFLRGRGTDVFVDAISISSSILLALFSSVQSVYLPVTPLNNSLSCMMFDYMQIIVGYLNVGFIFAFVASVISVAAVASVASVASIDLFHRHNTILWW